MKITVLGSGSWGTAVACLFADMGHDITLWSYLPTECEALSRDKENKEFLPGVKIPDTVKFTTDFDSLNTAELIVTAVPSHATRATARNIKDKYNGCPILNISKGLEQNAAKRGISNSTRREFMKIKVLFICHGRTYSPADKASIYATFKTLL